jgi:hypothetical protein
VQVVIGSNPDLINNFLFHSATVLFYIVQRITVQKLCIFRRPVAMMMILLDLLIM